ncbi:hypothetical protein [Streptomyces sp. NBC_00827]|uniref:hypothetical protein n=1 Tax=Streptomyces sp. NBC_00827 TaxID=2903677 RepID=UPI0038648BF5|nr:hypothetical protein OG569_02240 [Streptomyces sp. NBC_00827]
MTPHQVFTVAVIGGATALLTPLVLAGLAAALYLAVARVVDIREARRERRRDLTTCNAIDALGTNQPDR